MKKPIKNYCKFCRYRLKLVNSFLNNPAVREGENGRDICGKTLNTEINPIGETVIKLYGNDQRCDECGSVIQDKRKIRYQKCSEKNRDFNCKDFTPKWYIKAFPFLFR